MSTPKVEIDRPFSGRPHEGKVLAIVAPHSDDLSIFVGGTVARFIDEGYTGYFIRLTNDEKASYDLTPGQTMERSETETRVMAKILGIKQVFDLNYRCHRLDQVSPTELRSRLVLLFRYLKVDTLFTFDPAAPFEMNPEHRYTAEMAEYCCFLSGGRLDLPEQIAAGLGPHRVKEKYYWARGEQAVNRVVDITPTIKRKVEAICANRTQIEEMVKGLKSSLARQNLKLPILEGSEESALRGYVEVCFREEAKRVGRLHGLEYAEPFRYVGPYYWPEILGEYVKEHAVPIAP